MSSFKTLLIIVAGALTALSLIFMVWNVAGVVSQIFPFTLID